MRTDERTSAPPSGGHARRGTVDVGHHAPHLAVVTVQGEHDLSTQPELTQALEDAAAHSNVLVDLSHCSFMDSTVVTSLSRAAKTLQARGEQLALVIPPEQTHLTRLAAITRLADTIPLHHSREAGLTSLEHPPHAQPGPRGGGHVRVEAVSRG